MLKTLAAGLCLLTLALPSHAGETLIERAVQFENGRGVTQDHARAYGLYCLAALQGDSDAYYHLGWMHFNGRGLPRSRAIAAGWFARGAQAGDKVAANLLKRLEDVATAPDPACPEITPKSRLDRTRIESLVRVLAPEYELDPELVLAVIQAESNFNPRARSHKGAIGLMQLMPATAKRFGVKNIQDPLQNLQGGMAYLQWLNRHFDGQLKLILAAYNAGENAVKRYRGIPPYRETQHYVKKITRNYREVLLTAQELGESTSIL